MALAFPLTLSQFWARLPIRAMTLDLPGTAKAQRTRGGELFPAEYGARLWSGEVEIADLTADEYRLVSPMLHLLRGAGASFLLTDRSKPGPWADPAGTALGSAAPQVSAINSPRELTLKGLPAGYVISPGDRLAVQSGSQLGFHEAALVWPVTANSSGVAGPIEVIPRLRAAVAAGQAVTLVAPALKAVMLPDSFEPPSRQAALYRGGRFRWLQSLR